MKFLYGCVWQVHYSVSLEIICLIICWISGPILPWYGGASLGNCIPIFWGYVLSSSLKFGMSKKIFFFFNISVSSNPLTRHYILEKWNPQPHYYGNFKPCWTLFVRCSSVFFLLFVNLQALQVDPWWTVVLHLTVLVEWDEAARMTSAQALIQAVMNIQVVEVRCHILVTQ